MPGLQEIMGHAQITTTAIYAHLATSEIKREHDEASQLTQTPEKKLRRVI
jgi:site-specific recombinase XerD